MMKICEVCNSSFEKKSNESQKYFVTKSFCCSKCYWKSKIGKLWSDESRKKLSETNKGHRSYSTSGPNNKQWKRVEKKCKICGGLFVVKNYRKDEATYCSRKCATDDNLGLTPINRRLRKTIEYQIWRKAIFERDNYTCQECGERGGHLNAHHIKPFSMFPKLRLDMNNGITLCNDCHKTKHKGLRRKLAVLNNI